MNKIYLRKSRADGEDNIEDVLLRHEKTLQEYAVRRFGHPIPEEDIYREVVSGETIESRPLMRKLLAEIEKGNIDAVLVVDVQRLSRGSYADIDVISNTFRYTNTKVLTPHKEYNLQNKYDRKFFEQEIMRGNEYLEYVKDVLQEGRIRSVRDGYYIGSVTPFGYDKMKQDRKGFILVPNADADTVKLIYERFLNGMGTSVLAKYLNDMGINSATGNRWSPSMVRNILTREIYTGYLTYGKRETQKRMQKGKIIKTRPRNTEYLRCKGLHQPIISEETFQKAQAILHAPTNRNFKDREMKNPLASLVKCSLCGHTMVRRPYTNGQNPSLICTTIGCPCVSSDLAKVEHRVISALTKELKGYKYYVENYGNEVDEHKTLAEGQIAKIDKELEELDADGKNALINYNRGKITDDEYAYLKQYNTNKKFKLLKQKEALLQECNGFELEKKRKAIPILENCLNHYYNLSFADRHTLLSSIIDKIIYEKTNKTGRWNFKALDDFSLEFFLKI